MSSLASIRLPVGFVDDGNYNLYSIVAVILKFLVEKGIFLT